MAGGRPTQYTPELLEKAREYLNSEHATVPTIAGLALHIGVRRETCHVWAKDPDKEEFSNIIEAIMARQEWGLFENGLTNKFNPTITKLMLTKHGYTDKQDVTTGGQPLPILPLHVQGDDGHKEDSGA